MIPGMSELTSLLNPRFNKYWLLCVQNLPTGLNGIGDHLVNDFEPCLGSPVDHFGISWWPLVDQLVSWWPLGDRFLINLVTTLGSICGCCWLWNHLVTNFEQFWDQLSAGCSPLGINLGSLGDHLLTTLISVWDLLVNTLELLKDHLVAAWWLFWDHLAAPQWLLGVLMAGWWLL